VEELLPHRRVEQANSLDRRSFLQRSGLTAGAWRRSQSATRLRAKAEAVRHPPPGATVTTRKNVCTHLIGLLLGHRRSRKWRMDRQEPDYDSPINRGSHCCKGAGGSRANVLSQRPSALSGEVVNGRWIRISGKPRLTRSATGCWPILARSRGRIRLLAWFQPSSPTKLPYLNRKLAAFWGTNNSDHQARICHSTHGHRGRQYLGYGAMTNSYNDFAMPRPFCKWVQSRGGASGFASAYS